MSLVCSDCSEMFGFLLFVSRLWIADGLVFRGSSFVRSEVCFDLLSAYDMGMSRKVYMYFLRRR